MKHTIRGVVLAACLSANCVWGNSGAWLTGDELLQSCKDKQDVYKQGLCMGYILGAADGTTIWELWQDLSSNICISKKVEMGQVVDAVIRHLENHPRELRFDASSVVLNALIKKYPCDK